jgi:LmbE family N-acetylglucosaminyl deacetylase
MQRRLARSLLRRLMERRSRLLDANDLGGKAVVFSPHFDDETLACGGTIAKKRKLGTPVTVVFMTDGQKSHEGWIDPSELARLRTAEGLAAVRALGVAEEDVYMLGIEETRLSERAEKATDMVRDILEAVQPDEVYVPHSSEPPADHAATNRIVGAALRRTGQAVVTYEYPIWLWDFWPWTGGKRGSRRRLKDVVRDHVRVNALLVRDFKHRVFVGDVLGQKQSALAMHATQTSRMDGDPTWPILSDVADGDFLECLFGDYEFFARTQSG